MTNTENIHDYLDCYEQAILRELEQEYNKKELLKLFIKDINMKLIIPSNKEPWRLYRNGKSNIEQVCKEFKIKYKHGKIRNIIADEIDKGNLVHFWTRFDMLQSYCWYDPSRKKIHEGHVATIYGVDNKYYYLWDSPYVLDIKRAQFLDKKRDRFKIPLYELENALEISGDLFEYNRQAKECIPVFGLNQFIDSAINTYYNRKPINTEEGVAYIGREALVRLLKGVDDNSEYIKENAIETHWWVHLILSQLKMFRLLLESRNVYLDVLNDCVKSWDLYKMILVKNHINPNKQINKKVGRALESILQHEDELMKTLQSIKWLDEL